MATPGESSGTYDFFLTNAGLVFEAFSRCRVPPASITRHHMISARTSLNLELLSFSIGTGPNLWKIVSGTIPLVQGQLVYTLPTNLITMTELWYTAVNANGASYNSDRIMVPITRTQYAMLPNKSQPGTPTQFWYEKLPTPQITIWQPAQNPAPNYELNYFALQRIQDANLGTGETPDIVYRGLEALCARLAVRLATKFMDMSVMQMLLPELKEQATAAWQNFATDDQEDGPLIFQPNIAGYGRIG